MAPVDAKRQHERAIVADVARTICSQAGLQLLEMRYPEDDIPPRDGEIDGLALTTGPSLAIEHTLHQSFENQVKQGYWFKKVGELTNTISGTLPGPGRFELGMRAEALEGGQTRADLDQLEGWIRSTAPTLTELRGYGGQPTNVANGSAPEVRFPVQLMRIPHGDGGPLDGELSLRWAFDLDDLADLNVTEMTRILDRKLPKLELRRPARGLTVLLLENQDIQLVKPDNVTDAVRSALGQSPNLVAPDYILMINVIGNERGISWIQDPSGWQTLDRWYWVPITPA